MMFRWFDFNHRLNDQGLIDFELPQIFYTSIFQHKLKPHISQYDIETNSNQHLYFYENKKSFLKNPFKKWGASACACRPKAHPHLNVKFAKGTLSRLRHTFKDCEKSMSAMEKL